MNSIISECLTDSILESIGHCLDVVWLHFSKGQKSYCMHCQCLVRLFCKNEMIASSNDIFEAPTMYDQSQPDWAWYEARDNTLFDETLKNGVITKLPIQIKSAIIHNKCDVVLKTVNGITIELSVDSTRNTEFWRLFLKNSPDELTYICYGNSEYVLVEKN